MKLPKSKLGFLLAAVYIFIAGLFFLYAKFACSTDALYCGTLGSMPLFPTILLTLSFNIFFVGASPDIISYLEIAIAFLINVILFYFIGSAIQKRFSLKVTRNISIGAIIIAIIIIGILGVRYFDRSDILKSDIPTNVNNPINSRNYCQQDSDCVLAPPYRGCCAKGCQAEEAVNIETKNREEGARNKQCGTKDYVCPIDDCLVVSYTNQPFCKQNRCVVKEKSNPITRNKIPLIQIEYQGNIYTGVQGSGCWPTDEAGESTLCWDTVFPNPSEVISINHGDVLMVKTEAYEQPEGFGAKIYASPDDIKPKNIALSPSFKSEFNINMPPGIYILQIFGNWPVGDISYGFKIEVKEKQQINNDTLPTTGANYKLIGSFTSSGESSFVKVLGSTAYLTDISEGLLAIDVSNPEKPVLLDKIKIGNAGAYALAIEPNGPFAVVGGYGNTKVALVDISYPDNLRIADEIDAKRSVQDMVMAANNVYLAIDGPEVEVLTLKFVESNIGSSGPILTSKGVFQIQGEGHAIGTAISDINVDALTHNLIIAQGESGVGVYKKAEFMMPQFSFVSNVGYVSVVDADENYIYAGIGNSIKVVGLKTKKEVADIKVDDVWNFKVKNRTLYVASGENGVKVLDISDIKNPKQIAIIDTPGRARSIDVSVDGKYIYVADDRDDLQIIGLQ